MATVHSILPPLHARVLQQNRCAAGEQAHRQGVAIFRTVAFTAKAVGRGRDKIMLCIVGSVVCDGYR